jgi:DHA2 family multidrug resistance protein
VLLDKGQEEDWFGSHFIIVMAVLALIGLIVFVARELTVDKPFVNLRIMKNYNFTIGMVLMFSAGIVLYGLTAAIPLYLQGLMGYTALWSGLAMIPRGLGALIAMPLAGKLVGRIQGRLLVAFGFGVFGASSWVLSRLTLDISPFVLFWPLLVSGFSIAFMFVPLQTLAFGSLKPEQMANASGIFNLMRNVGGSVGIALITTLSTRFAQARQTTLVSHLTPYDTSYQSAVGTASSLFAAHGDKVAAQQQTLGSLYHQLLTQANFLAYLDIFRWFVPLCLLCAIAALILKNVKTHGPMAVH